jgi:hypothetical protein
MYAVVPATLLRSNSVNEVGVPSGPTCAATDFVNASVKSPFTAAFNWLRSMEPVCNRRSHSSARAVTAGSATGGGEPPVRPTGDADALGVGAALAIEGDGDGAWADTRSGPVMYANATQARHKRSATISFGIRST